MFKLESFIFLIPPPPTFHHNSYTYKYIHNNITEIHITLVGCRPGTTCKLLTTSLLGLVSERRQVGRLYGRTVAKTREHPMCHCHRVEKEKFLECGVFGCPSPFGLVFGSVGCGTYRAGGPCKESELRGPRQQYPLLRGYKEFQKRQPTNFIIHFSTHSTMVPLNNLDVDETRNLAPAIMVDCEGPSCIQQYV